MGAPHAGAARLFLGSVAQKATAHAACPVITWRLELLRTGPEAARSVA
jgi:nucleotide-binding universal stress UspA family protein